MDMNVRRLLHWGMSPWYAKLVTVVKTVHPRPEAWSVPEGSRAPVRGSPSVEYRRAPTFSCSLNDEGQAGPLRRPSEWCGGP